MPRLGALCLLLLALAGCTARRASGGQCLFTTDCADPLVCAAGVCRAQCLADRDCGANQACVSHSADPTRNVCVPVDQPSLCASVQCLSTQRCVGGLCQLGCAADSDCAGLFGPAGRCTDTRVCVNVPSSADAGGSDLGVDASPEASSDAGACAPAPARAGNDAGCALGALTCGASCADPMLDPSHCGTCTASCGASLCESARCRAYGVRGVVATEYDLYAVQQGGASGVLAWGTGFQGALGNDPPADLARPTPVPNLPSPVADLGVGYRNACAVAGAEGQVFCWGTSFGWLDLSRDAGAADGGAPGDLYRATRVPLPGPAAQVTSANDGDHPYACALLRTGQVYCWGSPLEGHLGDSLTSPAWPPVGPVRVPFPTGLNMAEVRSGNGFACARESTADGRVWCWGSDTFGSLGRMGTGAPGLPQPVVGQLSPAVALRVRAGHACMLTASGEVLCWGQNNAGQCLLPTSDAGVFRPTRVPLPAGVVPSGLVVGLDTSCVLTCSGRVWCWGAAGSNRLGPGVPSLPAMVGPTELTGAGGLPADLVDLTVSTSGGCAQRVDGTVLCWGDVPRGSAFSGALTAPSWP